MKRYKEYYIAFLVNLVASFVFKYIQVISWNGFFVLVLASVVFILMWIIYRYRAVGIYDANVRRGRSSTFRKCLDEAKESIDFLATWGGSIPSLSEYTENRFKELVRQNVTFRFLLLEPGSIGEERRKKTRGGWESGQPEADLRWFLNIKKSLDEKGHLFKVAVYGFEPVWSMVIVDGSFASVGYYGKGIGRDNPALTVQRKGENPSFLDAFIMQYERIWDGARELETIKDLDTLMENIQRKRKIGLVFAITGPSGVGKTAICQQLLERGYGESIRTITTRAAREDEPPIDQYDHVTTEQFRGYDSKGELLSYTEFCLNYYGIRRSDVYDVIENDSNLILDTVIEPIKLRQALGKNVVIIFLVPRGIDVLEKRIKSGRPTVSESDLSARMRKAREQLEISYTADYVLKSEDGITETLREVMFIIDNVMKSKQNHDDVYPSNLDKYRPKKEINLL